MPRFRPLLKEGGVALPVAIFALVVIGALVAGTFFTARIEVRSGESAMAGARATEAAQAGLQVGVPSVLTLGAALTDGRSTTGDKVQLGATGSYYQLSVTRLDRYLYLLRSYGTYEVAGSVAGTRTLAMLVKRSVPELNIGAALTVKGTPSVRGAVVVDGNDHTPLGWTGCVTAGPAVPGIRTAAGSADIEQESNVVTAYSNEVATGDTSAADLASVLDTLFARLAAQADIALNVENNATVSATPSWNADGSCKKSDLGNWGDPLRTGMEHACESYFPIVYVHLTGNGEALGTVKLQVVGQGLLLIDGDVELVAGSAFTGLMLVRGRFGKADGNATLTGGVFSTEAELGVNGAEVLGDLTLSYSSCAVRMALRDLSLTAPTTYRGFIQF